jgi:hypothetical protein
MADVLAIMDRKIAEAEEKARVNYDRGKWMMFGYWKAIAVHLRKVKMELRKELKASESIKCHQ